MKKDKLASIRRFILPNSLRYQLLSRSLFILTALLLLIGIFQYVLMQDFLYRNKAISMQNQVPTIFNKVLQRNIRPFRQERFIIPDLTVAIVDASGNFFDVYEDPRQGAAPRLSKQKYNEILRNDSGKLNYSIEKNQQGLKQLVVLQPIIIRDRLAGIMQLSTNVSPLREILFRQLVTFLSLTLLALILGILVFRAILRRTLIPLSRIVDKVEQTNVENLNERLPVSQGQLEIDRLAASFNGMSERLAASFAAEKEAKEQMRRFIADASHELRTPLTSIHGFLEILLRGAANHPDQLNKALTSMYTESVRINKLVQDLLLLVKLDSTLCFQITEASIDAIVMEMEPQLRLLAGTREVNIRADQELTAVVDKDKVKQVILNLFQNAVQHTDPSDGVIRLLLTADSDNAILLVVQDNGPGIPEEHQLHLFERFYRADPSRARKYGGAGLGLAITQSIVELHGGTIQVESVMGVGSTFKVRFPRVHQQANAIARHLL